MRVIASARTYRRSRLLSFGTLTRFLATPYRAKRWRTQLYRAGGDGSWWKIVGTVLVVLVMIFLLFPGVGVIIISAPGRL